MKFGLSQSMCIFHWRPEELFKDKLGFYTVFGGIIIIEIRNLSSEYEAKTDSAVLSCSERT